MNSDGEMFVGTILGLQLKGNRWRILYAMMYGFTNI